MNRRNSHHDRRAAIAELPAMFDRQPPASIEAEAALLGSMLLDWRVCGEVIETLPRGAEDFWRQDHAAIYESMIALYDGNQSIDMVQLVDHLRDRELLEQIGGDERLIELVEAVPNAASAAYYARIVRDKAMTRELIESHSQGLYRCYHEAGDVADLLDRAESDIFRIAEAARHDTGGDKGWGETLQEIYTALENDDGRSVKGIMSGFFELDEMTNGLKPGEFVILAARPSMGKTAFALNMAEHIAVVNRQPTVFFSMEMSREQLGQRMLCSRSGVDSHKLRRNMLTRDDFGQLTLAVGELSEAPLFVDDTPGLTLLGLRSKARRLASRHGIKAVFIDYLQLMNAPGAESRQQEISNISRGIKALARELGVPVVCLSQLNRQVENREGHRPRMSDLRESGSLEQDADVVMMLHREDYYHRGEDSYEPNNIGEAIVTKQRNGPTGTVRLVWDGGATRFRNLQHSYSEQEPLLR